MSEKARSSRSWAGSGRRFSALVLMACVSALPASGQVAAGKGPVVSLRIENRALAPGGMPGKLEIVYRLINDSAKTIVAWEFACVTAGQAGNTKSQGAVGYDGYASFERARREHDEPETDFIEPGQVFEQRIGFSKAELDGPLAGKTCGPVMVMFDDTTYEGLDAKAEFWFGERAKTAVEANLGREALEKELNNSRPLAAALDSLAAEPATPLWGSTRVGFAARQFSTYRDVMRQGFKISAEEVLASLDFQYQAAMKHLPPSWQQKVLAELER